MMLLFLLGLVLMPNFVTILLIYNLLFYNVLISDSVNKDYPSRYLLHEPFLTYEVYSKNNISNCLSKDYKLNIAF